MRYTVTDVRRVFPGLVTAAAAAGVDSSRWTLKEGSPTCGHCYGIVDVDPDHGGQRTVVLFSQTAREAYEGIMAMRAAFYLTTDPR